MPLCSHRADTGQKSRKGSKSEFDLGFDRIREALGFKSQVRLAEVLGICQSSISDASRRGVIPGEWALKLYQKHRLNPLWVYDGLPPVFLGQAALGAADTAFAGSASFLLNYPDRSLVYFQMRDASMAPVIPKDSFVGVDTRVRGATPEGLYGVDLPLEGRTVRAVRFAPDQQGVMLHAEDDRVPPQRLSLQEAQVRLVGRVVWVMFST
ncbi:hypothetical protein NNJEOMEG_02830 [Fundidesulfovibrio magnetotacticus]|uniref:Uncharacterized protein n=1 Tax=Fundidesulfovibrio magnetotacticus TaxID=2730080 RepID=A0A6V8LR61_9BACT|nr:helix-turn-helix domain-containing protein [Fundidesulfovibrio magnetotacticus]GFK94982.1 hypothetical protein NNJEOMEG_02830 [Fundidesulfovibrio magnetotacticus]